MSKDDIEKMGAQAAQQGSMGRIHPAILLRYHGVEALHSGGGDDAGLRQAGAEAGSQSRTTGNCLGSFRAGKTGRGKIHIPGAQRLEAKPSQASPKLWQNSGADDGSGTESH